MNQIIITSDGSHTLFVPELNEHYHSVHGAVQESTFIFINSGFNHCTAEPLDIFEVGFGTGLNAFLTALKSMKEKRKVNYTTIEKFPVSDVIIRSLNHHQFAGPDSRIIFDKIHSSQWNRSINICKNFKLRKIKGDFTSDIVPGDYDLIYFDAFGPDKQPEMWTAEMFTRISLLTRKGGIFVTYSAKGEVRRNLQACGFSVELLAGPPGKRQIIRAMKK